MNSNEIIKALKCKSTGERDCEDNNCKYKQVDGECDLDLLHCDTVNIIESLKTQLETKSHKYIKKTIDDWRNNTQ